MNQLKDYLGDSVYAEFDGYGITLTTDNGHGPSNTIYLEPEVIEALNRFKERTRESITILQPQPTTKGK